VIDSPAGRNDGKAQDYEDPKQSKPKLSVDVGGKENHGHHRKAKEKAGSANHDITSLGVNQTEDTDSTEDLLDPAQEISARMLSV
jgi:hypothetical protein